MQLLSTVRCPGCDMETKAEMPRDACVFFFECPECGAMLRPSEGDCCVFCSFGSVACPPVQQRRGCC